MEELLNKLIQRGWNPFGITCTYFIKGTGLEGIPSYCFNPHPHIGFAGGTRKHHRPSLREIVSIDSGLWQFVCENGMIRVTEGNSLCNWLFGEEIYYDETQTDKLYKNDNYEYWLIESALCDEDKLEKFLLENIKI